MMDRVVGLINSFKDSTDMGKLSILSPKLFPIIPSRRNRNRLLSPTLFSFQQNGYISLPDIFKVDLKSTNLICPFLASFSWTK
jgi:hypothetical protein